LVTASTADGVSTAAAYSASGAIGGAASLPRPFQFEASSVDRGTQLCLHSGEHLDLFRRARLVVLEMPPELGQLPARPCRNR